MFLKTINLNIIFLLSHSDSHSGGPTNVVRVVDIYYCFRIFLCSVSFPKFYPNFGSQVNGSGPRRSPKNSPKIGQQKGNH